MKVGRVGNGGRCYWVKMGFGLFFPKRRMDMKQDGNYANQEKLNVDNLRRGETNANINTKIERKKKDTHTHSNKRATEIFVSFFPK